MVLYNIKWKHVLLFIPFICLSAKVWAVDNSPKVDAVAATDAESCEVEVIGEAGEFVMPDFVSEADPMDAMMNVVMPFTMAMPLDFTEFQGELRNFESQMTQFAAKNFKLLGQANSFLKKKKAFIEGADRPPQYDVQQLATNMVLLSQAVKERIKPENQSFLDKFKFFGLGIAMKLPFGLGEKLIETAVTEDEKIDMLASVLEDGIEQVEAGLEDINKDQETLRIAQAALEQDEQALAIVIKKIQEDILPKLKAKSEQQGMQDKIKTAERVLTIMMENRKKAAKGALLAKQLVKVWDLIRQNFYTAISQANEAYLFTVPALRAAQSARAANAMARRLEQGAQIVMEAQVASFEMLADELGDAESQRQEFTRENLARDISSFERMHAAIAATIESQNAFEEVYRRDLENFVQEAQRMTAELDELERREASGSSSIGSSNVEAP